MEYSKECYVLHVHIKRIYDKKIVNSAYEELKKTSLLQGREILT